MSAKTILETYKDQVDMNRDGYDNGAADHYDEILRDALYTLQTELLQLAENFGNGMDLIHPDKVREYIALTDLVSKNPDTTKGADNIRPIQEL